MALSARREWPLVAFTLLSQTAVGALWTVAAAAALSESARGWHSRYLTFPALSSIVATLGVAAAISVFHLGKPGKAGLALKNIGRSWLSREILSELVLMASAGLLGSFVLLGIYSPSLMRLTLAIAVVASLLLLLSMSRLYMLATVPAWRSAHTPLSFLGSALLLGPLAIASFPRQILDAGRETAAFQRGAAVASLAGIVLIVLTALLFGPGIGFFRAKKAALREFPVSKTYPILALRLFFLLAAIVLLVLFDRTESIRFLRLALACALSGEIGGRCLFYVVYSRIGV